MSEVVKIRIVRTVVYKSARHGGTVTLQTAENGHTWMWRDDEDAEWIGGRTACAREAAYLRAQGYVRVPRTAA